MSLFWPRSLFGRNLALLLLVTLGSVISSLLLLIVLIQRPRIDEAAALIAAQTGRVQQLLEALPVTQREAQVVAMNGGVQGGPDADRQASRPTSYMVRRFLRALRARLPAGTEVVWEGRGSQRIWVRLAIDSGSYWVMLPVESSLGRSVPWSAIGLMLVLCLFPALGAWLIQRHTAAPLRRLARAATAVDRAAEAVGRGAWPEPVPVRGPTELATVAEAFNRMVGSLRDMEATRAEMLAGISHDIRTPLTKLRMAIAAPESFDAPSASAERFVGQIDAIVQQFIDYARGWDSEPAVTGDLNELVEQLAGDYAGLGHPFALSLEPLPQIAYRPVSMQRLLRNLMQNAVVHGGVGLVVRTRAESRCVAVTVEDAGQGVPAAMLPLLTQPFRRVERAGRAGGTGLGLAIADRIARQHGGQLDLSLRAGGGLAVTVRLPRA